MTNIEFEVKIQHFKTAAPNDESNRWVMIEMMNDDQIQFRIMFSKFKNVRISLFELF